MQKLLPHFLERSIFTSRTFSFVLVQLVFLLCFHTTFLYANSDIDAAMEATLKNNTSVLVEVNRIRSVGHTLDSAKYDRLPTIGLQAETDTDDTNSDRAYVELLQPIWVGGRITNTIDRAEISVLQAQQKLLQVQRDKLIETAVTYSDIKALEARIDAATKNVHEHEKLLALITRREAGQLGAATDINLAHSRLANALMQQERLQGLLAQRINDLFTLTQQPSTTNTPVPQDLSHVDNTKQVENIALSINADILLAKIDQQLATIDAKLSRSDMLPRIYGRLRQDLYREDTSYVDHDLETSIGVVMDVSLGGAGIGAWKDTQAADENVRTTQQQVVAVEDEIKRRIQSLITRYELNQSLIEINTQIVVSTKKTLDSYMRQYEAGRKSWLDLLNIQQEHAQARLNLEEVRGEFNSAGLQLNNLQGKFDTLITGTNYGS